MGSISFPRSESIGIRSPNVSFVWNTCYMETMDVLFFCREMQQRRWSRRFFGIDVFVKSRNVTAVLEFGDFYGILVFPKVLKCNSGVGAWSLFGISNLFQSPEM